MGAPGLTRLDAPRQTGHRFPQFLPDGRHFLYYVAGAPDVRGVYLGTLDEAPAAAPAGRRCARGVCLPASALRSPEHLVGAGLRHVQIGAERRPVSGSRRDRGGYRRNVAALSASAVGPIAYRTGSIAGGSQLTWYRSIGQRDRKDKRGRCWFIQPCTLAGRSHGGDEPIGQRQHRHLAAGSRPRCAHPLHVRPGARHLPGLVAGRSADRLQLAHRGKPGFDLYEKNVNSTRPAHCC